MALEQYMNMSFSFLTKWHNHVHAWKTSSSKGSLLREQSKMCGLIRECSESVSLHVEQVGPARGFMFNAILHPPAATVHTDARRSSSSTQDGQEEEKEEPGEEERTERRDEIGLFHSEKGCEWRQRCRQVDRQGGEEEGKDGGGRGPCAIRSCLCLSVCVFSHSRNQFSIRTVTVEQREKEACQVGHTQREMERDKTGTRRQGGLER